MKVWQHGKDCLHVEYGDRQIAPEKCYGRDCGGSWMQLVPADAETDFSLSNSSVVAPGQRLSEHLSQPERSSTEGRQLVPADVRMVSGNAVVIEKENGEWPEEVIDKAASAFDNSDRVARRLAIACLDALSVPDPTKTEPPKDPWDYDP